MKRIFGLPVVAILLLGIGLGGCADTKSHTQGVYMLVDTSGTYTHQLDHAQRIINYTLAKLNPGDSFAVADINTASFSQNNIIDKVTFDDRPSVSNEQKRQFRDTIDKFVKHVRPSGYTDITGGVLQAIEWLNEINPGTKTILIFSDMKQDLKKGYVRNIPFQMDGFNVVALNVTKLSSDNVDPRLYMDRLAAWQKKVEAGGGKWRVINDLQRLSGMLGNND